MATIDGVVGWRDVSAWVGTRCHCEGVWRVGTALFGDLVRFRWKQLRIETGEGFYWRRRKSGITLGRGPILGCAAAAGFGIAIGIRGSDLEASGWPQAWDTLRVWSVTGRSVGLCTDYWFTGQLAGMERWFTPWRRSLIPGAGAEKPASEAGVYLTLFLRCLFEMCMESRYVV